MRSIIPALIKYSPAWKSLIWVILVLPLLFACRSDDEANDSEDITGEWLLIEMLADPGDGSGVFVPVESSKTITFSEDGTYSSNGDICSFTTSTGNPVNGIYTKVEDGYNVDCETPFPTPLFLNLDEGDLIIAFSCFEPCLQKFQRIE